MRHKGFTLIELIVGITIFTVVIVALYSAFTLGIKTWRRSQDGGPLQKLRLTFLKVEKELKNTFFFSRIPFNGTEREMVFPLSISDGDRDIICVVTYCVDVNAKTGLKELKRKERVFSEGPEPATEKIKRLLPSLKEAVFEYAYAVGDSSKDIEWQRSWDGQEKGALPSGIRISLKRDGSEEIYSKVVFLQHGELGKNEY